MRTYRKGHDNLQVFRKHFPAHLYDVVSAPELSIRRQLRKQQTRLVGRHGIFQQVRVQLIGHAKTICR